MLSAVAVSGHPCTRGVGVCGIGQAESLLGSLRMRGVGNGKNFKNGSSTGSPPHARGMFRPFNLHPPPPPPPLPHNPPPPPRPRTRGIGNPQKYLDHTFHSSPPHVRSRYPAMLWYRYGKHGAPETTWTLFRSSIKDGIDGARGILREDRFVGPCVFCWRVKASMRSRKRSPGLNPERLSGVGKSNLPQQCS